MPLPEIGEHNPVRVCKICFEHETAKSKFYEKYIPILTTGQVFLKHGRTGFPHDRLIKLSDDHRTITWEDLGKNKRFIFLF